MGRHGRVATYTLLWLLLVLLFAGGVWWVVNQTPVRTIDPDDFAGHARNPDAGPAATIDRSLSATDIKLREARWTYTGNDGKVTMLVKFDEAAKEGSTYSVKDGSLSFLLKNQETGKDRETLIIRLNNATYSKVAGVVKVRGTLIGQIAEGGHYFKAEEMSWDQSKKSVSTKEVQYRGPGVDVSGKQMRIDLQTGEVRFDGPVDVGI